MSGCDTGTTLKKRYRVDDDGEDGENLSEAYVPEKKVKTDVGAVQIENSCSSKTDEKYIDETTQKSEKRIIVHTLRTPKGCTHEVAVPPNYDYQILKPIGDNPAKEYKFTLDPFQRQAVTCIHNEQSVLVSAHTSAGKTVVAEYAIATALRAKQRVIYTTPIKALSNQKYHEFSSEFEDVGLITGDATINYDASCLVMTTEILRNMLYRGTDIIRQVGWIIFDEIHYMRNTERGVIWEESISLLQENVRCVFLSATIPNARQFAEWICEIHQKPCNVIYSDNRPTPLQHYLYPAGAPGIYLIVDEKGEFIEKNFKNAIDKLLVAGSASKSDRDLMHQGVKMNPTETNIFKVIKLGFENKFVPMICFSFSKKECEAYAMQMAKLTFVNDKEKATIKEIFKCAIDTLSPKDQELSSIKCFLPLLSRGIGIHHGGLLPILKEVVELLFAEGLIKVLFATETFSMGLNMPAKTVIFTSIRKFDGVAQRTISSGEYIQMSGRAGRRGLDEQGIVIMMIDEKVTPKDCRELMEGNADPLNSAFRLTYNMILHLLRVQGIDPEFMLERSFYQFQHRAKLPYLMTDYEQKKADLEKYDIENEEEIKSYYNIRQALNELEKKYLGFITKPETIYEFLAPGRLIKFKLNGAEYNWALVVNFKKKTSKLKNSHEAIMKLFVNTFLKVDTEDGSAGNEEGEIMQIDSEDIVKISKIRLRMPSDLSTKKNKLVVLKDLTAVLEKFQNEIPLLDPIEDMEIKDENFNKIIDGMKYFEKQLFEHRLHSDENLAELYKKYDNKVEAERALEDVERRLAQTKSLVQLDELKNRKRVLCRLNYCDDSHMIKLKGRVACEISGGDELVLTELIFDAFFNDLTPAQCAALLSVFVCEEKAQDSVQLSNEMQHKFKIIQNVAKKIAKCMKESGVPIDEEQYVDSFKASLIEVTLKWASGSNFADICTMTDIFEGSIIRSIRRLEELLRQMMQAAKATGNTGLVDRFTEANKLVKRDIMFAASLYL